MFKSNEDDVVTHYKTFFSKCPIGLAYCEAFKSFLVFFEQNRLCTEGLFNLVEKDMIAASAWKLKRLFQIRKNAQIVNNECD